MYKMGTRFTSSLLAVLLAACVFGTSVAAQTAQPGQTETATTESGLDIAPPAASSVEENTGGESGGSSDDSTAQNNGGADGGALDSDGGEPAPEESSQPPAAESEPESQGEAAPETPGAESERMDSGALLAPMAADLTPPVLTNLVFTSGEATAPGEVGIEFDLVEDGSGLSRIGLSLTWKGAAGNTADRYASVFFDTPLRTGKHTATLSIGANWHTGEYTLTGVSLSDAVENSKYYAFDNATGMLSDSYTNTQFPAPALHVTNGQNTDTIPPVFTSLTFLQTEATAPGEFEIEFDLVEEVGLESLSLGFTYRRDDGTTGSEYASVRYEENEQPKTGRHKGTVVIAASWPKAEYKLNYVSLYDKAANNSFYYPSYQDDTLFILSGGTEEDCFTFSQTLTITQSGVTDSIPPQLTSFQLQSNTVKAPGLLTAQLGIVEEGGLDRVSLSYTYQMTDGSKGSRYFRKYYDDGEAPTTGTHTVEFSVSPIIQSTEYALDYISLYDKAGNSSFYSYNEGTGLFTEADSGETLAINGDITVENEYDIDLYLKATSPRLAQYLQDMPEGKTALVEYSYSATIPAEVFAAIAGSDKTVIFYSSNVQWVFNGKDIQLEDCKDVELWLYDRTVPASLYGLGESDIVELNFASNGKLPGPATIRVNNSRLQAMHAAAGGNLYITHWVDDKPTGPSEAVTQAADLYSVFTLSHNSVFTVTQSPVDTGGSTGDKTGGDTRPGGNASARKGSTNNAIAPTGDSTLPGAYMCFAALALLGIAGLGAAKRKRNSL